MEDRRVDYYSKQLAALKQERVSFVDHWRDLARFVRPRKGRFMISDVNKGDKRYNDIINGIATRAHRVATAGLYAGTMSPARPWFSLETVNPDLMESTAVKLWLARMEMLILRVFRESNFYNMAPQAISELVLFGTANLMHVDDFDDIARFYTHTIGSYYIAQDAKFRVNTMFREFQQTTLQMVAEYGLENVSTGVKTAYDQGNYHTWRPVIHVIEPNDKRNPNSRLSRNKAFKSCYFEPDQIDKDKLLSEMGYDEFPCYIPRWDTTGEDVYGTDCPGMQALGDVKGLQLEEKRKAQAIDKMTNPPLKGPSELANKPVSALPGGLTTYSMTQSGEGLSPVYQVQMPLGELRQDIAAVEQRIKEAFYNDMFIAITEIEGIQPRNEFDLTQRHQERLLQLGPALESFHGEFLDPAVNRAFNQLLRADAGTGRIVPPPPPELQGKSLRVSYISALAMAQRSVATGAINGLATYVGNLAGAYPEVLDKFDADESVDQLSHALGANPKLVIGDDIVAQRRQARAQAQAQAAQIEQAQQIGQAAQAGAGAFKSLVDASRERVGP